MTEVIQLTDLKKGQKAVISELAVFDDMRRRLQDIGLIEGTVVEKLPNAMFQVELEMAIRFLPTSP